MGGMEFGNMFGIKLVKTWGWKQKYLTWRERTKGLNQFQILANLIPSLLLWETWKWRNEIKHDKKPLPTIPKINHWLREITCLIKPTQLCSPLDKDILKVLGITVKKGLD